MIGRLLNALEKNVECHDCALKDILYEYDETLGYECQNDCVECKKVSLEQIEKLKQSLKSKTSDTSSDASSETRKELDKDDVNHPSHYNVHKHECIDEMIALFGVDETMAFCKLNAHKYRYRVGAKDGEAREKDLAKADWYIDKFMELKEKKLKKTQKKEKESKGVSVKNNNQNKKKRKYFRKCGVCGNKLEQSDMVRTNKSDNGWACEMCYNELTEPVYDENEF